MRKKNHQSKENVLDTKLKTVSNKVAVSLSFGKKTIIAAFFSELKTKFYDAIKSSNIVKASS
jgi:hypothetical protein